MTVRPPKIFAPRYSGIASTPEIGGSRNCLTTASRAKSPSLVAAMARQRAIRYADREYGAFDEIELEPYNYWSEDQRQQGGT
jgi:hypothetical protein